MVVESFLCPACAEPIPAGRLSCPQCGTVLAAVARSFRAGGEPSPVSDAVATASPERSWLDGPAMTGPATEALAPVPAQAPAPAPAPAPAFAPELRSVPPEPVPTPVAALLEADPSGWDAPTDDTIEDEPAMADVPNAESADPEVAEDEPVALPGLGSGLTPSYLPVRPRNILDVLRPAGGLDAEANAEAFDHDPAPVAEPPPAPAPVSAWIPPSRAVAATATEAEPPARILPRAWDPAAAAAAAAVATTPPESRRALRLPRLALPGLDRRRVDEAAGVLMMAGAMGAAIGFVLPWSRIVIGARNSGGYFDSWGLAGPAHIVVFALALATLVLAAMPNRIDTWLRTGVVGILLGSLLLGLAWPYAFGPLGAGVGIVLVVVSACLLLLAGLINTLVQRHAGPPRGV
jgi:hypothetical protein